MDIDELPLNSSTSNAQLQLGPATSVAHIHKPQPRTMVGLFVSAELDPVDPDRGAAGMYRNPRVSLGTTSAPKPAANEVLITPLILSVCGSDYHLLSRDAEGRPLSSCPTRGLEIPPGVILGHEFAGRVVALGNKVDGFRLNEVVTADSLIPCRNRGCTTCRDGLHNYCPRAELVGFQRPGAFAQLITIPASSVHSLKSLIPLFGRKGAMVAGSQAEPIGVAYHAIQEALSYWHLGRPPALRIFGAGLGLYVAALAKVFEMGPISIVEPLRKRRELAARFAAEVIDPSDPKGTRARDKDFKVDFVFDCFGVSSLESLLGQLNPGGSVILLARRGQQLNLPVDSVMGGGKRVVGVRGHVGFVSKAVELLARRKFDPRPLITQQLTGFDSLLSWMQQPEKFRDHGKVICDVSK